MTPLELKILRKQYHLTQSEFGARLVPPVSRLTVYNWENAKFAIPADIEQRLTAADLVTPAMAPKETAKQQRDREAAEADLAKHWRSNYRMLRAWPHVPNHAAAMKIYASQGHVIPQCAYAGIVADFPDILTDPNGDYTMSPEQSRSIILTPNPEK